MYRRHLLGLSPAPLCQLLTLKEVWFFCLFRQSKSWFHQIPLVSAFKFWIKNPVCPAASSKTVSSLPNSDLLFLLSHYLQLQNVPYYQKNRVENSVMFTSDSKLAVKGKKGSLISKQGTEREQTGWRQWIHLPHTHQLFSTHLAPAYTGTWFVIWCWCGWL